MTWNWQSPEWPNFKWNDSTLLKYEKEILFKTGEILGVLKHFDPSQQLELKIELLTNEAFNTSLIEGELLNRQSIQSSIKKQLGLQQDKIKTSKGEEGIADLMLSVYDTFERPLDESVLFKWHSSLMKGRPNIKCVGAYREHPEPMQIVSGYIHNPKVHFEAPSSEAIPKEMKRYIEWFNNTAPGKSDELPPLIRAGVAHLYFESIHPFEDGNGRIGRAIAEKALAQSLKRPTLILLSNEVEKNKKQYYKELELANKTLEVTRWLTWFSQTVLNAQNETMLLVEFVINKNKLMQRLNGQINTRQEKVLLRMLDAGPQGFKGGLSANNYRSITTASTATATRDLQQLIELKALTRTGENKGTRYWLNLD